MPYVCCAECKKLDTCKNVCDGLNGEDDELCTEEMQKLGCDEITDDEDCFEPKEA
jgi:hypothetical protein